MIAHPSPGPGEGFFFTPSPVSAMPALTLSADVFPIAGRFTISRGSKTEAHVITVRLSAGGATGWGEGVPYPRYGESVDQALGALAAARARIECGVSRADLAAMSLPMAARNALDCALWDLEAKHSGRPVWQLAELPEPHPVITAYTISLDTPDAMAAAAAASGRPLLKLKLGRPDDDARLAAIRAAAPQARLIVDANEGWQADSLPRMLAACAAAGVELVEQPLAAGADEALRGMEHHVMICADESAHGLDSLPGLMGKYDAVNIKLDKAGGLTPALAMARAARARGLKIMVGCMVGSSLAMAPASLLAPLAEFVDLDGPLLLAADREHPMAYAGSLMMPPPAALWG